MVQLKLTVHPSYNDTVYDTICANEFYTWRKHTISPHHDKQISQVTYADTLSSVYGCDSITTLQLTLIPTYTDTVHHVIGVGDTFSLWGKDYLSPGIYISSYRSVRGCDSIITHWVHKKISSEEQDIIAPSGVSVYPSVLNACEVFKVDVLELSDLRVYDVWGREVYAGKLSAGLNICYAPCVRGIYNVVIECCSLHSCRHRHVARILVM